MLDARSSSESVSVEHFDTANHTDEPEYRDQQAQPSTSNQDDRLNSQETPTRRPQKKMITEDEIVGQSFVFLLAGYETSSNTLAFTCYLLALNPECQCRVQEEVDDFFTRHVSMLPCGSLWSHYGIESQWRVVGLPHLKFLLQVLNVFFCYLFLCRRHQITQMSRSWSIWTWL